MSKITDMLSFNEAFVQNKGYEKFITSKFPEKKVAILCCMDTRLTELLPAALNFKNGDVKIIKNAGALVSHPFGSVMRSFIVAIYEQEVDEILVIGHYDCGMQSLTPQKMIEKMLARGVNEKSLEFASYLGIDINTWLQGFDDPINSVKETVKTIRRHPFIPKDVTISGYIMDPETGKIDVIADQQVED